LLRFEVYRAVTRKVHAIFAYLQPLIEPLSPEEAYIGVQKARDRI
jgi:DNA polymerase IV